MAIPFAELNKINPSSIIELFELELVVGKHIATGNPNNLPTTYRFHAGANIKNFGEIEYQNALYQRLALEAKGFEKKSSGVVNRPTIAFSNLGGILYNPTNNTLITMSDFLNLVNAVTPHNDLIDAKITRKLPLASALDDANFTSGSNPFNTTVDTSNGTSDRLKDEIYVIDRKGIENRQIVQFELTAAHDLENRFVPQRVITRDLFPAVGRFI
jgi:lambda family phage minor tail protein L|tara:strand:- start:341 stop:982 length:642 start_codon:yes stop_codon:yes gene_type:complete